MSLEERKPNARDMIRGMPFEIFDREIRETSYMLFNGVPNPPRWDALFSLEKLDALLAGHALPSHYVDLVIDGVPHLVERLQQRSPYTSAATIREALETGATMRVRDLQLFDPNLQAFCADARREFNAECQVNCYLTPAHAAGFNPHFDTTDIFILQCVGEKEWSIHGSYTNQRRLPLRDTPWEPLVYRPEGHPHSITLMSGDSLYLPRGVMHSARCRSMESMHLTVSLAPLTMADVMSGLVRSMSVEDERLRRRLRSDADASELVRDISELFAGLGAQSHVAKLLQQHRDMTEMSDTDMNANTQVVASALQQRRQ